MVRSTWLPTMPVHVANWMADPRVQMLEPADRCHLIEALFRSWMVGVAVSVPETIGDVFAILWPEYAVARADCEEKHRVASEKGKRGNEVRWNGSPSDRPRIAQRSPGESPKDRKAIASEPEPEPEPKPEPNPNPSDLVISHPEDPTVGANKSAPKRRWRRVDPEFVPNATHESVARELGLSTKEASIALSTFLDHEFAAGKLDGNATFRNWLIEHARRLGLRGSRSTPGRGQPLSRDERTRQAFAEDEALERLAKGEA